MKHFIRIILVAFLTLVFVGCGGKKEEKRETFRSNEELVGIENIIMNDEMQMRKSFGNDFRYYESYATFDKYFDSGSENWITELCTVFQVLDDDGEDGSFDTRVIIFAHRPGSTFIDKKAGIFVENYNFKRESVKLSFIQAYEKMKFSGLKKPKSRFCSLRKQFGLVETNPQYVFGNAEESVYVDAVTGEVSDKNPVYPGLKGPSWKEK